MSQASVLQSQLKQEDIIVIIFRKQDGLFRVHAEATLILQRRPRALSCLATRTQEEATPGFQCNISVTGRCLLALPGTQSYGVNTSLLGNCLLALHLERRLEETDEQAGLEGG